MTAPKLILDHVFDHEAAQPERVLLTQPVGGGRVIDYSWGQALSEARRMAAHLQGLGLPRGARIAMLSKNCAHFVIAELAIWMAGGTTVAIFPTETADTVRHVLEHSQASLLFIGKLDNGLPAGPVPEGLPCIALPLAPEIAPATAIKRWDDIVARTEPLAGRPQRAADDIAMLLYTSGSTGEPKGVMHSFGRITRTIECMLADPARRLPPGVPWRTLSYLPLAHVYERAVVQCRNLMAGDGQVFFSESLATFSDDVRRARPTVFVSVPRLWLKFQQGVLQALPTEQLDALLADPATAAATGRRVLASLGLDEVHLASVGAAPMPPSLLAWYRRLGLHMVEGYGMSEDFAYSHRTRPRVQRRGPCRRGLPRRAGAHCRGWRGADQVAGPDGRLLPATRPERTVLHRRRLLSHRRPWRTGTRRAVEAHRPRQGAVQDLQGQVRGAGADRDAAQCAPDGRALDRGWPGPAAALCAGDAGRVPCGPDSVTRQYASA